MLWEFLNEDGNEDGSNGDGGAADDATKGGENNDGGEKNKPAMSDKEAALLKEVMAKKEALDKTKTELKAAADAKTAAETKLAQFDGIDLEKVKALLKQESEREQSELEKKGEWDRLKKQMSEQHQQELEAVKSSSTETVSKLTEDLSKTSNLIKELTIGRAFSESTFIREDLTLTPGKTRIVYGSHFELQGDKVVAYDKPAGSETRTMLVDSNGEPLSFDKAMAKIVDADTDRDNLLRSKMKSGSGSENDPDAKKKDSKKEVYGKDRIKQSIGAGLLKFPEIK